MSPPAIQPSSVVLFFPAESRHLVLSRGLHALRPIEQIAHTIFFVLFAAGLWRVRADQRADNHVHVTIALDTNLWPSLWGRWRKRRLRNTARWAVESLVPTGWLLTVEVVAAPKAYGW